MNKVFFASDFHLGIDADGLTALQREQIVSEWMRSLPDGCKLYLLGDIFDYWYEYRQVIPRGYSHFFSAFRQAIDRGIHIEIYTGNHDMWMYDYFQSEYGIPVHHQPNVIDIQGKKMMIGHGDGLGPEDKKYKIVKKIFRNRICQRLFRMLHPDFALKIMANYSKNSRDTADEEPYLGKDEWLVKYAERKLETQQIDYFVFGHRHRVIDHLLSNDRSRYLNLGDWVTYFSYAVLEDGDLNIHFYKEPNKILR